uniref:EF-hand domain-containing protein n=1 Tax=viral metagenome TaxID=1070528 RepID=A0A6C0AY53_9ZZZZ|tara:strand:+ start:29640 stop:30104 length:465 start_codon:yes stop_codon:yes gene_type:complete
MVKKLLYNNLNTLRTKLNAISNNKFFIGLAILILNIGSRYVELNISKSQEAYIRNTISREIFLFTVVFVGTRDIITALIMTATLVILSDTVFNVNSKYCMIPEKYKKLEDVIDRNKDNYISDKEIDHARKILYKANIQNKRSELSDTNYFHSNI